jgi:hypothetical protein
VPHLACESGRIVVTAEQRLLHLMVPGLQLGGTVQIRDGVLVYFVPDDLQLGRARAGALSLQLLGDAINPLVDTRTLPYGLVLQRVVVSPPGLEVTADAHPTFPLPSSSNSPVP